MLVARTKGSVNESLFQVRVKFTITAPRLSRCPSLVGFTMIIKWPR